MGKLPTNLFRVNLIHPLFMGKEGERAGVQTMFNKSWEGLKDLRIMMVGNLGTDYLWPRYPLGSGELLLYSCFCFIVTGELIYPVFLEEHTRTDLGDTWSSEWHSLKLKPFSWCFAFFLTLHLAHSFSPPQWDQVYLYKRVISLLSYRHTVLYASICISHTVFFDFLWQCTLGERWTKLLFEN